MNVKRQAENINQFLTKLYSSPTRLSTLLLKQGISTDQISSLDVDKMQKLYFEFNNILEEILTTKSSGNTRLYLVIQLHYALDGYSFTTLEVIGHRLFISRERVRQLEVKAFRRLRSKRYQSLLEQEMKIRTLNILQVS